MAKTILGVRFDTMSKRQAVGRVRHFLLHDKGKKVYTPNPEMLVDASRDEYFTEVLNAGDINLCDGIGVRFASGNAIEKIAGADFILEVCKLASEMKQKVFLLGTGRQDVLDKASAKIVEDYRNVEIVGTHLGIQFDQVRRDGRVHLVYDDAEHEEMMSEIIMAAPDIVFVAFGHGKQEKWIDEHIAELPSVKVAMGVGGSLNYMAGQVTRAPKFVQNLGFEWLWRLCVEPWRIVRILKAVIVFPVLFFVKGFGRK